MRQLSNGLVGAALMMTMAGCGLVRAAVKANHASNLEDLEKAGDHEALDAECQKPRRYSACKARGRVANKRLQASTCESLVDDTKAYYRKFDASVEDDVALLQKFYDCERSHVLFQEWFGIRHRAEAWSKLEAGGTDVFGPLMAHLDKSAANSVFAAEAGKSTARAVAKWLVASGDASRCAPLAANMSRIAPGSRGEMLWFFSEVGCREEALPMAVDRLTSDSAASRIQACDVLAKHGDAAVLDRLETLAETDGYKQEREVRTSTGIVGLEVYFPVRERCLEAAGKVRLRG